MPHAGLSAALFLRLVLFVEATFIIGGLGMSASLRGADARKRRHGWTKFFSYLAITHLVLLAAGAPGRWFLLTAAMIAITGGVEFISVAIRSGAARHRFRTIAASVAVYGLLAAGTILFAAHAAARVAVFTYAIVAVVDAFSQLAGQLIGRILLAPRLSPNKTIEGALGGLGCAAVASLVLSDIAGVGYSRAVVIGMVIALCGIGGDLLSSWYKRLNRVKDYSSLLPGQGGVVDRFNSLLAAAPMVLLIVR